MRALQIHADSELHPAQRLGQYAQRCSRRVRVHRLEGGEASQRAIRDGGGGLCHTATVMRVSIPTSMMRDELVELGPPASAPVKQKKDRRIGFRGVRMGRVRTWLRYVREDCTYYAVAKYQHSKMDAST